MYLGFIIFMGINRLPEIRDYWARDEKLHNTSRITSDRFEERSQDVSCIMDPTTLEEIKTLTARLHHCLREDQ